MSTFGLDHQQQASTEPIVLLYKCLLNGNVTGAFGPEGEMYE